MQALICRVNRAFVERDRRTVGGIAQGTLVLLSVDQNDGEEDIRWMAQRLRQLREDEARAPDADRPAAAGELLLVSSVAMARGLHPDSTLGVWEPADEADTERVLRELARACGRGVHVAHHDMTSNLVIEARLDGPVVNVLDSKRSLAVPRQSEHRPARWADHASPTPSTHGATAMKTCHRHVSALLSAALGCVLLLGGCNTLEGTGEAAKNITHGIAEDARAIVNSAGSANNEQKSEQEESKQEESR